jgi:catechol 2,3-dioxygenase-like lactoylglutathione lyase family enzyme
MFDGIDHIVIVVSKLDSAIESYTKAGFTVVPGGKHPIGTHNALIAFADDSYIELIAFLNPVTGHPWHTALEKGGGIIDFCMRTADMDAAVEALRKSGAKIADPSPLTRDRPDGYHLSWVLAIPQAPFNGQVPFLIKDVTPREERVPRQQTHRNGVTGIQRLTIAVDDPGVTSRYYARVLGRPGAPVERPELEATGASFQIGPNELQLLASKTEDGPIARWIRERGQCAYEATLARGGAAASKLDPALLQGARLSFG